MNLGECAVEQVHKMSFFLYLKSCWVSSAADVRPPLEFLSTHKTVEAAGTAGQRSINLCPCSASLRDLDGGAFLQGGVIPYLLPSGSFLLSI